MAAKSKPKPAVYGDTVVEPPRWRVAGWHNTNGTYIAGRAYIDEADHTAAQMEAKWGVDRLRLLVGPELREKLDRQRYKFNQAIYKGELEDVRREAQRMVTGWLALDKAATANGARQLDPNVWEVALADGSVAAIARNGAETGSVAQEGRRVRVYTLDEIARLLSAFPLVVAAKVQFEGAEITAARTVTDPLLDIHDTGPDLDDPLPPGLSPIPEAAE